LEEENEDKPAIVARFVEQFHVQKKTSVYSHTCLNLLETTGLTQINGHLTNAVSGHSKFISLYQFNSI
jgi:hypothetical protein